MKLFQFLLEDEHNLIKAAIKFYNGLNDQQKERTINALQALTIGIDEKKIFNTDFGNVKNTLNMMYEIGIRIIDTKFRREVSRDLYMHFDASLSYGDFNGAKKQIRCLEKALKEKSNGEAGETNVHNGEVIYDKADIELIHELIEFHKAGLIIKVALDEIKPFIVKGRKPSDKPIDPNTFQRKIGSKTAQDKVKTVIGESIKDNMNVFEKAMEDFYQGTINRLIKANKYTYTKSKAAPEVLFDVQIIRSCFDYKHKNDNVNGLIEYNNLKLTEVGKGYAKINAKQDRDLLEDKFLNKAVTKLSHIVDLKGNLKMIEPQQSMPIQIHQGSGHNECGFKFIFDDTSEFLVVNKVVRKSSYTGTPFEQFPTTFHDVIMPDGKPMKQPSEERMIKIFAVGK